WHPVACSAACVTPTSRQLCTAPFSSGLRRLGATHRVSQKQVRLGLVTGPVALQPFDHVGIPAHGDGPLRRAIELAHLGAAPVDDLWHVRKINVFVFLGRDSRDFALLFLCRLLHSFSSREIAARVSENCAVPKGTPQFLPPYPGLNHPNPRKKRRALGTPVRPGLISIPPLRGWILDRQTPLGNTTSLSSRGEVDSNLFKL